MDLVLLLCGKLLGEGTYRKVYRFNLDTSCVIKFELDGNSFSNITEWKIWEETKYSGAAMRWLAPCVAISPYGNILVQKYAQDVSLSDLPKRIPRWMTDLQPTNFGRYKGRIVARDYGLNCALQHGMRNKLQRANWRKPDSL
jgi:hypothetical protein